MEDRIEGSASVAEELRVGSAGLLLLGWVLSTLALWFFAFYDLPSGVPEWVRRAQAACFGRTESGLPTAAGWIVLALGPLSLLSALILAMGQELSEALRRWFADRTLRIGMIALIGVTVIEFVWIAEAVASRIGLFLPADELPGISDRLPEGYPRGRESAPELALVDQFGARVTLASLHGRPVILTFVFAHCATVCPTLVRTVTAAAAQSPRLPRLVLISLDPWRDTPAALPDLAKQWEIGPENRILSGTPEEVNRVLDEYRVPRQREMGTGEVVHPALVVVLSASGELAFTFNNPPVQWILDALDRVEH